MKFTLFTLLALFSISSFASTCYVSESTITPGAYDNILVEIPNVGTEHMNTLVLIHKNGTVDPNFDPNVYFEDTSNADEYNQALKDLKDSRIVSVSVDKDENQLTIATGLIDNSTDNLFAGSAMALAELDAKKVALFDIKLKLAIYCSK